MSRAFGSISMAIGKIEKEEAAEKEVNTTMGVNFLIIILGSNSPPLSSLAPYGGQAQRNSIRGAATRYQNKSSIKSAGAALGLILYIPRVVVANVVDVVVAAAVVIGNKLGSPQFRKKVKFCNCCSTADG